MNYYLIISLNFSVGLAAIIGWANLNKVFPRYFPFLILLTLASLNECIGFYLIYHKIYTQVNNNIYMLIEAVLITWQFKQWDLFKKRKILFYSLLVFTIAFWLSETHFASRLNGNNSYFLIVTGAITALMSILLISEQLLEWDGPVFRNPLFLICAGLVIFFVYQVLLEIFWLKGFKYDSLFAVRVQRLFIFINLFSNLVYTSAMLCIRNRRPYTPSL